MAKTQQSKKKRNSRERISGNNTSVYQQNSCHFALKIVNPNIHAAMSDQLSSVESRWYRLLEDHSRCRGLMHTTCHSQWHRWRGSNGFLFSSLAGMEWKYNLSWFPVSMSMFQGVMKGFSQIWFGNGACARPTWPNVYIYNYNIYGWLKTPCGSKSFCEPILSCFLQYRLFSDSLDAHDNGFSKPLKQHTTPHISPYTKYCPWLTKVRKSEICYGKSPVHQFQYSIYTIKKLRQQQQKQA